MDPVRQEKENRAYRLCLTLLRTKTRRNDGQNKNVSALSDI